MANESDIESIVKRFFESRSSGRIESLEEIIAGLPDVPDTSELRTQVAGSISTNIRNGEFSLPGQDDAASLPAIDGYEIIDLVGRGAMGVVYEAYQVATGQRVAIKFLSSRHGTDNRDLCQRFEREVDLTARLQHPGAPAILDSGIRRGQYYYVMQFIEGQHLGAAVRNMRQENRLKLLIDICDTVDYAHERGVLHRDLKPSNILVDKYDRPHVLDFGLAKALDTVADAPENTTLSMPGQLIGTFEYMAPEQSRGNLADVSFPADIYALGAIGYEFLTGSVPLQYEEPLVTFLQRLETVEPVRPSRFNSTGTAANWQKLICDKDLDAVVLKALAKEPGSRYKTAGEFAEDLRRWLNGQTVIARRPTNRERLHRWAKRNPVIAGLALLTAGLLSLLLIVTWIFTIRVNNQRLIVEESAYYSDLGAIQTAIKAGDNERASDVLNKYRPEQMKRDLRCFAWYHLNGMLIEPENSPIVCEDSAIVSWLPNAGALIVGTSDKVGIHQTRNGENIRMQRFTTEQNCSVNRIVVAPRDDTIAIVSKRTQPHERTPTLQIWKFDDSKQAKFWRSFTEFGQITAAAFAPVDDFLVFANSSGKMYRVELKTEDDDPQAIDQKHDGSVSDIGFTPNGEHLISSGEDQHIRIYNLRKNKREDPLLGHQTAIRRINISPDGSVLVSVDVDSTIRMWDVLRRSPLGTVHQHDGVRSVAFSPGNNLFATTGDDKTIRIWSRNGDASWSGNPTVIRGHSRPVHSIVFLADNILAASEIAVRDELQAISEVRIWNVERARERESVQAHDNYVRSIAFSADGNELYSGGHDGSVNRFSVSPFRHLERLYLTDAGLTREATSPANGHRVRAVIQSRDGNTVYLGGTNDRVVAVSTDDPERQKWASRNVDTTLRDIAVSFNDQWVASAHEDGMVYVWDAKDGALRTTIDTSESGRCVAIAFVDKNGNLIATGNEADGRIRIWDTENGKHFRTLNSGHGGEVRTLAVSPDFSLLASGSRATATQPGIACLWDLKKFERIHTLESYRGDVEAVSFSADAETLATAGTETNIRLWNVKSGKLSLVLQGHVRPVGTLEFSDIGGVLASGDYGGVIRLWRARNTDQSSN